MAWDLSWADRQHAGELRIVGVWTHGAAECDIPEALERYADAIVGWQADRIQGAICGDINESETSEGQAREQRPIARYSC